MGNENRFKRGAKSSGEGMTRRESAAAARAAQEQEALKNWVPKTELGRLVKSGKIHNILDALNSGQRFLESEITDILLPGMEVDYVNVGQAKGKFGGGKRRIIRQTQKKTQEGSKLSFSTIAVVGNKDGVVGVGSGKAAESVPAKDKAVRKAKLNLIEVQRGCGSWECGCGTAHSLPFEVEGKSGSVRLKLIPAPKGTGLAVENELKKILKLAGYKDLWSQVKGQARHKQNLVDACVFALKQGGRIRRK